jgi:hypothetical protein
MKKPIIITVIIVGLFIVLGCSLLLSKRIIPVNVKSFIMDYTNRKITGIDSVEFWGIGNSLGDLPGKHYIRSIAIDFTDTTDNSIYTDIELDTLKESILSVHTKKHLFLLDKQLNIKNMLISDTTLNGNELEYYKLFLSLKAKYGIDQLSANIRNQHMQIWFKSGRLYGNWSPSDRPKIWNIDYWLFPWITYNPKWVYIPYRN